MRAPVRIVPIPNWRLNPYQAVFYEALAPHGVEVVDGLVRSPRTLWRIRRGVDALHFHWPEALWNGVRESPRRGLLRFVALLMTARLAGLRVIWTAHNLTPHEGGGGLDRAALRLLARRSDVVICHSHTARTELERRYPTSAEVVVMPHGNYDGSVPPPVGRGAVCRKYGLDPDRPILACVGHLRDYKGLDTACEAAALLGEDVQLVIAGKPHREFDLPALEAHVAAVPGALLIAERLSDQEVADLVGASDLVLLPYHAVTGSGALLMAWTLGSAVVASDLPYFRELIEGAGPAGWCAEAGDAGALADAVRTALGVPGPERAAAARAEADRYAWEACVIPVAQAIDRWVRPESG